MLEYVLDGLRGDMDEPRRLWYVRWGLDALLPDDDGDITLDLQPPARLQRLWEAAVRGVCYHVW